MIISHKYKFIFLKTKKTAGTSLEIALSRLCDERDVVTPIGEEKLRKEEGGRPGKLVKTEKVLFKNHVTASHVKAHINSKIWNNYCKFTIERNPWDKAISAYYFSKKGLEKRGKDSFPSLSEHLIWLAKNRPRLLSNWDIYTIDDEIAVDRVIFYENLTNDLSKLANDLGVREINLPKKKVKGDLRENKCHYREVLSQSDAELIKNICQREIETFGYQF